MAALSDYLENEILDQLAGGAAAPIPANLYIAAHTADPTDDGSGAEVSGGAYSRVSVTNNLTEWPAASGGTKSNANAITFPEATASWGSVTHIAIWDASSSGNLLWHGSLSASKTIGSGDTLSIAAGDLDLTVQ